jgi:membrane associated rhomboid family serine protease
MFQLRRPGRGITILIGLHAAAFVSTYILGGLVSPGTSLLELLALNPTDVILRGRIWQPITAVLFHAPGDVFDMFSTALWLWFLGSQVESMVGTRKLFETYAWTAAGSVALTMIVGLVGSIIGPSGGWTSLWGPLHIGPTGAILGLVAYWVARMDRQVIHFALLGPMQARTFGILLLAGVALARFLVPDASLSMHLGGIGMGYAIGTGRWPPNRKKSRLVRKKKQLEKELRRFEVIEGGRSGQPKDADDRPRGWTGWNNGGPTVH